MSDGELLLLASALALLTYALGVLVLTLPIPLPGLKRWGPALIKDALFAFILVVGSSTILYGVARLQRLLGADWANFSVWVLERSALLLGWKLQVLFLTAAASKVLGGQFAQVLLDPLSRAVNYALLTIYTIIALGVVIKGSFVKLFLLGLLLMSVPFRLTKTAGSYMLGFSIAFFVGLPLMPSFVDHFANPATLPRAPNEAIEYGAIEVKDALGYAVSYPMVRGILNGSEVLSYLGDANGVILAGFPDRGLPSIGPYTLLLDYMGKITPLEPDPVVPSLHYRPTTKYMPQASIVLETRSLYLLRELEPLTAIYRSSNVGVRVLSTNERSLEVEVEAHGGSGYLEVRYPSSCNVEVQALGAGVEVEEASFEWAQLEGLVKKVGIPGNSTVFVRAEVIECGPLKTPMTSERRFVDSIGFSPSTDLTRLAASLILSLVVMPAVYVALLSSAAGAIAYLIGGARERLPMVVW
ncbi:MAG: hypothetical protein QXU97_01440 [Fervidicoccaceae archaeon]